jgi:hypothetical protein
MVYVGVRPMDKHPVEAGIEDIVKTYELLDRVRRGRDVVIRDDQFDREALFDAARAARARRVRISVLDTGRFDPPELERLIRERVRICTSDEARPREAELDWLLVACRKAGAVLSYFQHGPLETEPTVQTLPLPALRALARSGMDIHISNLNAPRDPTVVTDIAEAARKGRAFLAYYHHGPLAAELTGAASQGAWVHVSDRSLDVAGGADFGLEIACAAREAGSRLVLYIERGLPLSVLDSLFNAGAAFLFLSAPCERGSRQWPLEEKARKRSLPFRASYLSPAFLP